MDIDQAIRDIVREELAAVSSPSADPDLIKVEQAAEICECDPSVIYELVKESPSNGFPSVRLGTRTIRIDKRRLSAWFARGGLGVQA